MTREFRNGQYFSNPSGRDFDNGRRHNQNSARGVRNMFALFQNGEHQMEYGHHKDVFEIIFDGDQLRQISKRRRVTVFMRSQRDFQAAVKRIKK